MREMLDSKTTGSYLALRCQGVAAAPAAGMVGVSVAAIAKRRAADPAFEEAELCAELEATQPTEGAPR